MPTRTGTGSGPCSLPMIVNGGPYKWSLESDVEGFRRYEVYYKVQIDPTIHGPYTAWRCPGLPVVGSPWTEFGDPDPLAFFTNEGRCTLDETQKQGENSFYDVVLVASTKPTGVCPENTGGNQLLVPDRVKLRTVNYQKEGVYDFLGQPIVNSAWEQIRGPQNEWDAHRLQVVVEQNVPNLEQNLIDSLMHTLNDAPMWGQGERQVKLSDVEVDEKFHLNCERYYVRRLVFDISREFDRCFLDEGTKCLRGRWDKNPSSPTYGAYILGEYVNPLVPALPIPVDPNNPRDFIRYKDWNGEPARTLLRNGRPVDVSGSTTGTADDTPGTICVGYYPQGNLFQLGVPTDLENP